MTQASTAATAATASSAGRLAPCGSTRLAPAPSPLSTTPLTTIPSARTNRQNSGLAAATRPRGVAVRWASARTASTTAPASAAQAGLTPASDATTKPASVAARTASVNPGSRGRWAGGGCAAATARSARKNRRNTTYSIAMTSSQPGAISSANRGKDSPLAANASRLVRLETGSSSEAEFAR